MDKTNSKILTFSFLLAGALTGLTVHLLMKSLAAASGFIAKATGSDLVRHGIPVALAIGCFFLFQFSPFIRTWADEVVTEIRKVNWPGQKETTAMTIAVVVMVVISSVIVTIFDFVSSSVLNLILN